MSAIFVGHFEMLYNHPGYVGTYQSFLWLKVGVNIEVEIRFPPCSNRWSRRLRLYRDRNVVLLVVVHQTKYDSRPGSGMSS